MSEKNKISREMRFLLRGYAHNTLTPKQKTKLVRKVGNNCSISFAFAAIQKKDVPPQSPLAIVKPAQVSEAPPAPPVDILHFPANDPAITDTKQKFEPNSVYMQLR